MSSPKMGTDRAADASEAFAASQAATNLTTRTNKPKFAPQRLVFINTTGAAVTSGFSFVDEEGRTHTNFAVPAGPPTVWDGCPIATLTTPAGVLTLAHWYEHGCPAKIQNTARN